MDRVDKLSEFLAEPDMEIQKWKAEYDQKQVEDREEEKRQRKVAEDYGEQFEDYIAGFVQSGEKGYKSESNKPESKETVLAVNKILPELEEEEVDYEYDDTSSQATSSILGASSYVTASKTNTESKAPSVHTLMSPIKLNRTFPRPVPVKSVLSGNTLFERTGKRRRPWTIKPRYTGESKRECILSDNMVFLPCSERLPLMQGAEVSPVSRALNMQTCIDRKFIKCSTHLLKVTFHNQEDEQEEEEPPNLHVTKSNSPTMNHEKVDAMSGFEDLEVTIPNEAPVVNADKPAIFSDICWQHFLDNNCRNRFCLLEHHISPNFGKNLTRYPPEEIWHAYIYCKETKLIYKVFESFVRSFVDHSKLGCCRHVGVGNVQYQHGTNYLSSAG